MARDGKLNAQMERFCQEYIKNPDNQTAAAAAAGYKNAAVSASRNMDNPKVQERIAELMKQRNKRTKIGADYVLKRLVEIDELDLADIMNDDLTLKPLSAWPKAWRQFLSGVKVAELFEGQGDDKQMIGVLKSIKWPDKVKNLELIGKHVDVMAFKERLEVSGTITIADRMAAARRRVKEQAGGEE
ncbi:terminase small subunit [Serratia marcescens]|uniref:Phage terminase small subunit n=1 Tax=Serratia marcescens TaxID=615 RepID=A0A345IPS4_SERMA|nr:terminase small subunit [Serratia marcescens]ASM17980.1 terminase small subunit [Serratia marcescens]AXH01846.1 phage terminase small subunit [Serratia marcescens]RLO44611.1 terminase small subunit [Serratia marcescens]